MLQVTALLLLAGTLLFYYSEHGRTMKEMSSCRSVCQCFFPVCNSQKPQDSIQLISMQSSVPLFLLMTVFMFIGGATGSTAGGVKVNNIAVILSYFQICFFITGKRQHFIITSCPPSAIIKSFTVYCFRHVYSPQQDFFILSVYRGLPPA